MDEDGCPICRLARQTEGRYLRILLTEGVNDPDVRDLVRASGGFCSGHGAAIATSGDNLPVAIFCQDLVNHLLRLMESPGSGRGGPVPALPCPSEGCRVCVAVREATDRYSEALLDIAGQDASRTGLERAGGLCVPHLQRCISLDRKGQRIQAVLAAQRAALRSLSQELAEFIRKKDYRFASEPSGREGDAWQRAIRLLSGARGPSRGGRFGSR
jgi:hypothetical protein